jgi:hypothetical protein
MLPKERAKARLVLLLEVKITGKDTPNGTGSRVPRKGPSPEQIQKWFGKGTLVSSLRCTLAGLGGRFYPINASLSCNFDN